MVGRRVSVSCASFALSVVGEGGEGPGGDEEDEEGTSSCSSSLSYIVSGVFEDEDDDAYFVSSSANS